MKPLTKKDVAALVAAATILKDSSISDCIYDVRDREGLGWDGPLVAKFGEACNTLERLRKEGKI